MKKLNGLIGWALVLGAVVVLAVVVVNLVSPSKRVSPVVRTAPTTVPAQPTTTVPQVTTITVTGSGPAQSLTFDNGSGSQTQHNGVALPFTTTVPFTDPGPGQIVLAPSVEAQSSSGSADTTITCEIDMPYHDPVTETSTGPYAIVFCIAP